MPRPRQPRRARRRYIRKARRAARKPARKSLSPMAGNVATIVETWNAGLLNYNTPYEIRETLNNYVRAKACAELYQFYRLTKLRLEWQPTANQYLGVAASTQVNYTEMPQIYMMMNRNGSLPTVFDEQYLLTQGANPKQFTRNIEFVFKPNTLLQVGYQDVNLSSQAQGGEIQFNKWIGSYLASTVTPLANPVLNTDVEFYGLSFFVAQPVNVQQIKMFRLKITAHWEFKQPASLQEVSPLGIQKVTISKENAVLDKPIQV